MKSNKPVRFTRPVKVVAPVAVAPDCVKLAALNVLEANTVSADVTVTSPRRVAKAGVTPPTAPVKVMLPAPATRVRSCAPATVPSSVLLNRMSSPAPAPVVIVTPLVNVTPRRNEIPSFVLAMLPPIEFRPAPS